MDKKDNKKRYRDLKASGICTQCKRKPAIKDRVKCGTCLYDDREYRRAKREMSTAKIVIEKKEYEELKEKAKLLDSLIHCGVEDWVLYPDAMALLGPDDD